MLFWILEFILLIFGVLLIYVNVYQLKETKYFCQADVVTKMNTSLQLNLCGNVNKWRLSEINDRAGDATIFPEIIDEVGVDLFWLPGRSLG